MGIALRLPRVRRRFRFERPFPGRPDPQRGGSPPTIEDLDARCGVPEHACTGAHERHADHASDTADPRVGPVGRSQREIFFRLSEFMRAEKLRLALLHERPQKVGMHNDSSDWKEKGVRGSAHKPGTARMRECGQGASATNGTEEGLAQCWMDSRVTPT
jgi:hypothetical protein